MRWQCSFHDSNGLRCPNEALKRIHFNGEHPFDHMDACDKHMEEYKIFVWIQDLIGYGERRLN